MTFWATLSPFYVPTMLTLTIVLIGESIASGQRTRRLQAQADAMQAHNEALANFLSNSEFPPAVRAVVISISDICFSKHGDVALLKILRKGKATISGDVRSLSTQVSQPMHPFTVEQTRVILEVIFSAIDVALLSDEVADSAATIAQATEIKAVLGSKLASPVGLEDLAMATA